MITDTKRLMRNYPLFLRRLSWPILLCASLAWAGEGVVTMEGARIRGDQESPTVLYLVPWQPPIAQSLQRSGGGLMVEGAIEPLERSQFQRVLSYHQRFQAMNAAEPAVSQSKEEDSE